MALVEKVRAYREAWEGRGVEDTMNAREAMLAAAERCK
jgi:hypothetical protein